MARVKPPIKMPACPRRRRIVPFGTRIIAHKIVCAHANVKLTKTFSASCADPDMRYLCNDRHVPAPYCIPAGTCLLEAAPGVPALATSMNVSSIKAGLLDAKVSLASGSDTAKAIARAVLKVSISVDGLRRAGSPPAFALAGLVLDVERYKTLKPQILRALIVARARVDPHYVEIVRGLSVPQNGYVFVLRKRSSGHKPFDLGVLIQETVADLYGGPPDT